MERPLRAGAVFKRMMLSISTTGRAATIWLAEPSEDMKSQSVGAVLGSAYRVMASPPAPLAGPGTNVSREEVTAKASIHISRSGYFGLLTIFNV